MFGLNPIEVMIVCAIAVLLFGSRLPSVARSLGKSMMEFKKGIGDIHDEVRNAGTRQPAVTRSHELDDRDEPTAVKFEPPTAENETQSPSPVGSSAAAEENTPAPSGSA